MAKRSDKPKAKKVKEGGDLTSRLKRLGPYPRSADGGIGELARLRLTWHVERARIVDSWRRRNRLRAVDIQEINFPTEEIAVDLPEGERRVRRNRTRVRQSEAWRHNQLTVMQRQAETNMEISWKVRTQGFGPLVAGYTGMPSARVASPVQDLDARLEQEWLEWFREALAKKIAVAVVLDVLTEPRTLADIEKSRKLKRGKALAEYQRGLDLWCEQRGWKRQDEHRPLADPLTAPM